MRCALAWGQVGTVFLHHTGRATAWAYVQAASPPPPEELVLKAGVFPSLGPSTHPRLSFPQPGPITEMDGAVATDFFTVLSTGHRFTEDQWLNVQAFSMLRAWLLRSGPEGLGTLDTGVLGVGRRQTAVGSRRTVGWARQGHRRRWGGHRCAQDAAEVGAGQCSLLTWS